MFKHFRAIVVIMQRSACFGTELAMNCFLRRLMFFLVVPSGLFQLNGLSDLYLSDCCHSVLEQVPAFSRPSNAPDNRGKQSTGGNIIFTLLQCPHKHRGPLWPGGFEHPSRPGEEDNAVAMLAQAVSGSSADRSLHPNFVSVSQDLL